MLNKGSNLNKPHNSVITYILCYVQFFMGKKNKLICIGYTGLMKCYLNITEREAIQRYIKDENISETQMEMDNDIQINHIEFDNEFGAYSVWE